MTKNNYRFAHYATRIALFELKVDRGTTVGALKALAEEHLSSGDDFSPMRYFDQWYCEGRVGMTCIEERANALMLHEAGLADESLLYLEGPLFTEGQAGVGRAIAAVRAESKAANALAQVLRDEIRSLKAITETRLDSMEARQQEGEILSNQRHQALNPSNEIKRLPTGMARTEKQHSIRPEVDKILLVHHNRPMKALYEAMNDKAEKGIKLPMAIIMDQRCGIERRAKEKDVPRHLVGASPLILAIDARRLDAAKALLVARADPSAQLSDGRNSLMVAASEGDLKAVEFLLSYGADINAVDGEGATALHFAAAAWTQSSIVKPLVRLGANLDAADNFGCTPLHDAVLNGRLGAIKALLKQGANQAAVNNNGQTPLHCAASNSANVRAIEAFRYNVVAFESNLTAVDRNGHTPLQVCEQSNFNGRKPRALLTPK